MSVHHSSSAYSGLIIDCSAAYSTSNIPAIYGTVPILLNMHCIGIFRILMKTPRIPQRLYLKQVRMKKVH